MPTMRFLPLPADTIRAAESAFGRDHPYLKIGKELETILADFEIPVPVSRDTAMANTFLPYSLASILQYWENLTDHQMINAIRTRLDLKYVLHLSLGFPGFEPLALCRFRQQLLNNHAWKDAFQAMVERLRVFTINPEKSRANADQIISALCLASRAENAIETICTAIEAVASHSPEWLLSNALPHWYKRYDRKFSLLLFPRTPWLMEELLLAIGRDSKHLLDAVGQSQLPILEGLLEIQTLRQYWSQQFEIEEDQIKLQPMNCSSCKGNSQSRSKDDPI